MTDFFSWLWDELELIWYAFLWILTGVKPQRDPVDLDWSRVEFLDIPLVTTFQILLPALLIGFVLAVSLALMRLSKNRAVSSVAAGYVFVFRGTPVLVQIFLIYYGLGQFFAFWQSVGLWWFFREPYWCAVLALALNTAAYSSEIVRGGVLSVPHGQIEAARAVGMSRFLLFRRIVAPIAIRQALPAYGNELILMVKATSLASTITIMELTGVSKRFISDTFAPIEGFVAAGAIYLTINFLLTRLVYWLEHRLTPHMRPRIDPIPVEGDAGMAKAA